MTTPSYDAFQQTFCLSALANRVWLDHGAQADLQAQLQQELSYFLTVKGYEKNLQSWVQPMIGNWSVSWGPVVWQNSGSTVADNALYVAHCGDVPGLGETYVVAIAATNPLSDFDWQTEDFDVVNVVNFSTFAPLTTPPSAVLPSQINDATGTYISMGTATGVYKLLQMVGAVNDGSAPATLAEYLSGPTITKGATIIVTGHSLAGALSPTLALVLKNAGTLDSFATAHVYPTAGASPGNANFAAAYKAVFPPVVVGPAARQQWNTLLWNQYDVVPHAWYTQPVPDNASYPSMANAAALYTNGNAAAELSSVQCLVGKALQASQQSGIAYTPLQNQSLPGTLFTGKIYLDKYKLVSVTVNVPPNDMTGELAQMGIQHMSQYGGEALLNTGDFAEQAKAVDVPLIKGVRKDNWATVLKLYLQWTGSKGCGTGDLAQQIAQLAEPATA
ncbi:MAG TPA: hypothetical protein VD860_13870 [Azospirillum sp.]|nr:hypothetical protein [Azospirillum sp.]